MQWIDMDAWPRRRHYDFFTGMDQPYFSLTAEVDVSRFYEAVKGGGHSLTVAMAHVLARCAIAIPEFRMRIRDGRVLLHDTVSPSFTLLAADDLFSFCTVPYHPDFLIFEARARKRIAEVKNSPTLADGPNEDNLLYMTSIPWVHFTAIEHPKHFSPPHSVPQLAWGRIVQRDGRRLMPLNLQVHHGLMDGLHAGRFFERVQQALDHPGFFNNEDTDAP